MGDYGPPTISSMMAGECDESYDAETGIDSCGRKQEEIKGPSAGVAEKESHGAPRAAGVHGDMA